jgi:hypothetical protein
MDGKSHTSDRAMREEALAPGGRLNASELSTTARSTGMNKRGDVTNWKLQAAMMPTTATTHAMVTSPPKKERLKRVGS